MYICTLYHVHMYVCMIYSNCIYSNILLLILTYCIHVMYIVIDNIYFYKKYTDIIYIYTDTMQ